MTRDEVFTALVKGSPGEEAKIAFAIASVPNAELRRKYMKVNALLFLCLNCSAIFGLLAAISIDTQQSSLFIVLRIAIPLVLSYFVYHFHGGMYRLLFFWCLFDLAELVFLGNFDTVFGLVKLFSLGVAVILSIRIALKVFPHLNFLGPKQDSLGRYLL